MTIGRSFRERQVVYVRGGLGNQLFQLAWGLHVAEFSGRQLALDLSHYRRSLRSFDLVELGYNPTALGHSIISLPIEMDGRLGGVGGIVRRSFGPRTVLLDGAAATSEPAWWLGYWQSGWDLASGAARVGRLVASNSSCSPSILGVHVRRGDFVRLGHALPADYFHRGVEAVLSRHNQLDRISVWSDDPEWCEAHCRFDLPTAFHRGQSAASDLLSLTSCGALVLSRGTFSWWAAHLGPLGLERTVAWPKVDPSGLANPNLGRSDQWFTVG